MLQLSSAFQELCPDMAGFSVLLRNYPNLSHILLRRKCGWRAVLLGHTNNQRMVPSIFGKPRKTKSFVAPDDKRSISVFEVIILVQASSSFGYRELSERVAADTFLPWLTYPEIAAFFFRRLRPVVASWHSVIFEERCILRLVSQSTWHGHPVG